MVANSRCCMVKKALQWWVHSGKHQIRYFWLDFSLLSVQNFGIFVQNMGEGRLKILETNLTKLFHCTCVTFSKFSIASKLVWVKFFWCVNERGIIFKTWLLTFFTHYCQNLSLANCIFFLKKIFSICHLKI